MNDAGGKKNVVAADKIRQLIVGNDAREIDKLLEPELLPEIQNCLGHVPESESRSATAGECEPEGTAAFFENSAGF